jgi:hypothetical protein
LGPLLSGSQRLSAWMDAASSGQQRFQAVWTLGAAESRSP